MSLQMLAWVFIFSITWNGRNLFQRTHDIFVDNEIVASVDRSLGDLWYQVSETARLTFAQTTQNEEKI
jgi:hypothetical protein